MKIHICADMEGTCGVVSWLQVTPPETAGDAPFKESEYERSRARMTAEVNAAARGAFRGGATQVTVNDFHNANMNILIDQLDERCRLVAGGAGPLNFLQGMESDCAGIFLTGFHAKAGTESSALAHTWSTNLNDLRINGESTGEYGLIGYVAGHFGVPALLVTGDQTACDQADDFLGGWLMKAVVKEGISQTGAINMHPKKAQGLIEEKAEAAMQSIGRAGPKVIPTASKVELDFDHQVRAEAAARNPGIERIGARSVAFQVDDGLELLNTFLAALRSSYVRISP